MGLDDADAEHEVRHGHGRVKLGRQGGQAVATGGRYEPHVVDEGDEILTAGVMLPEARTVAGCDASQGLELAAIQGVVQP